MGSKTSAVQALTPEVSRAARQELGMSQAAVSKAAGIPSYIIKQFEAGRFRPTADSLRQLQEFYVEQGVDMDAMRSELAAMHTAQAAKVSGAPTNLPAGLTGSARPGFMISDALSIEVQHKLIERMEANDDRIADLMRQSFTAGLFGPTEESESGLRELIGTLAESYLLFRFLQGRNILAETAGQALQEPKTLGDYLANWVQEESQAADLFAAETEAEPAAPTKRAAVSRQALLTE